MLHKKMVTLKKTVVLFFHSGQTYWDQRELAVRCVCFCFELWWFVKYMDQTILNFVSAR